MTKKSKLIIAGSTILAGSVITGIAVPLSQKANEPTPEEKQEEQQDDDSKKTEEKNGQAEANKQQVDSTEEKQKDDVEAASGEKTEEKSEQAETNEQQVDPQKDSAEEKQKDDVESGSGEKTEEDNKAAEQIKPQVDSQNNGNGNQQNNVKVDNSNTIESSKQKITELKSQLIPVKLKFEGKYFFLRLKTSKEKFEKIKNNRLVFTLDKGDLEFDEFASKITQNHKDSYYLNYLDEGNNVSFEITSEQRYGDVPREKGQYKVTKVWLSNDNSKTNLLEKNSNPVQVK